MHIANVVRNRVCEPLLDEMITYVVLQKPRQKEISKVMQEFYIAKKNGQVSNCGSRVRFTVLGLTACRPAQTLEPDPDPKSGFKKEMILKYCRVRAG